MPRTRSGCCWGCSARLALDPWSAPRRTRAAAALALSRIGGDDVIQALTVALEDPDPQVGGAAPVGLSEMGDPLALAPPLAAYQRDVVATVRSVVDPLVARGAAALVVTGTEGDSPPTIDVRPVALDACPITVQIEDHQLVSLFMGEPTWSESWFKDRWEYLEWVRVTVKAVVAGSYEEWVHEDGRRAVGTFHLAEGPRAVIGPR